MTEKNFNNRELSWLDFNQRVLDEATDPELPLLERLNFLAITASNLDEFFMVRIGALKLLVEAGSVLSDPAGMQAAEQLQVVDERTRRMIGDQYRIYLSVLEPELIKNGIHRMQPEAWNHLQAQHVERFFNEEIFPVVTPMAVDAESDFPGLLNLGLYVAVRLKPAKEEKKHRYALIPIGANIPRFIALPAESGYAYSLIEEVIGFFAARFFPGEAVAEIKTIRATRNADISARDEFTDDFLAEMKSVLDKRRTSNYVRLEVGAETSLTMLSFLQRVLRIADTSVYKLPGPVDLSAFKHFSALKGFEACRYESWPPHLSPDIDPQKSMFEQIAQKDILLFHPYESFDPVLRFVQEAARDPHVLAIKQTLYRTSTNSPIVAALREASERGKYVTVIVELKARFDEARNIEWARELERSGVQVIYGVKGLKVHAKICIVVRREHSGIVRYLHFGTGNYNERTARIYSDLSYMTMNPDLGLDASAFFNAVAGYSGPQNLLKLAMAPVNLRETIVDHIIYEIERKKQGQKAFIIAKMNSLVDPAIIKAFYDASRAGIRVQLNVRGICCLRPGVAGLSENISVISIIDRYLEHARIFYFYHGGEERMFISSADCMPRNLDRRIELLVPIENPDCRRRLIEILHAFFNDKAKARRILPHGNYEYVLSANRRHAFRAQRYLYDRVCQSVTNAGVQSVTTFEPLKPSNASS